jgi:putative ATPase
MNSPLADLIRPLDFDDMVGQQHILGKDKPLRKILDSGHTPNMIFYGPPGIGKTTAARIIANKTNMTLHKLNGTTACTADIKEIINETNTFGGMNGILLYLDEIQYLNKKQQQSLLEFIENGKITLIASTTENPYFSVFNAILSRSTIFEFKQVSPDDILIAVRRAFEKMEKSVGCKIKYSEETAKIIAMRCGGDVRKAMNTVELCVYSGKREEDVIYTSKEDAAELIQKSNMRYDKGGDQHYDLLSALQKSIRGSDENAALYYLARLIKADDLLSICRRLLVIASEDIGLAYPMAVVVTKSCVDSALQIGFPEARIPLAQAVVLLATSPKSNSSYMGLARAMKDVDEYGALDFPRHLQNKHADGEGSAVKGQHYLYPHDYPNHYVKQQYLPDEIKDHIYYEFGDNKQEQAACLYSKKIKL